ncbi:MAG: phosphohistidine phosphatase SixA [bacterium]|nr:phosphohistidine phosphatase SixA [bacterium]MDT8365868.1 phosphohistidine phosphatase SixA [bacterium]
MLLYLMRHGEAVSEGEDRARPLSKQGETDVRNLAGLLAHRFRLMPGHIFHSPKVRAAQTASIISQALPRAPAPEEREGLRPSDDPAIWSQHLEVVDKDAMLVGHLPRLASLLLLHDSSREIIDFTPGTMVCLEKAGTWGVKWMISPDTLKSL